jgi:hypothetical protein
MGERLPYKQDVGTAILSSPTKKKIKNHRKMVFCFFLVGDEFYCSGDRNDKVKGEFEL